MNPTPTLRQLLMAAAGAIVLVGIPYLIASLATIWAEAADDDPIAPLDDEQEAHTDG